MFPSGSRAFNRRPSLLLRFRGGQRLKARSTLTAPTQRKLANDIGFQRKNKQFFAHENMCVTNQAYYFQRQISVLTLGSTSMIGISQDDKSIYTYNHEEHFGNESSP